jgi:hypothetical protein
MTFVFRNKKGEETQSAIRVGEFTYCTKHFTERDKRIMEDTRREALDQVSLEFLHSLS